MQSFPHATNQQLVTDMANSVKETISVIRQTGHGRANGLDQFFSARVHELMRHRAHNVNTDW